MRIFFYVWEFQALFFCVECSWVCLHGTVRSISCIYVVAQAPRNRRSPPVPCHGCKSHKSTQSRGISPSARTTIKSVRYRRAWPVHCIHIIVDRLCFKSSCYHPQHIAKDTIEDQFLCHATARRQKVAKIYSKPRNLGVCTYCNIRTLLESLACSRYTYCRPSMFKIFWLPPPTYREGHDRKSRPVPCHGCKSHKSIQSRGISAYARTTVAVLYWRAYPVHCIHTTVDRLCLKFSSYHPQHIAKDTIEDRFLSHATAAVSRTNLLMAEESWLGEPSLFTVYIL